ncbi:hypothetical protein INR49_000384 [Caranx melampygus]|nr:hypothetical protein INR49_000384 [Caranx melampygus]
MDPVRVFRPSFWPASFRAPVTQSGAVGEQETWRSRKTGEDQIERDAINMSGKEEMSRPWMAYRFLLRLLFSSAPNLSGTPQRGRLMALPDTRHNSTYNTVGKKVTLDMFDRSSVNRILLSDAHAMVLSSKEPVMVSP